MKSKFIIISFILVLSIIASLPLLKPGLHTIHDDQQVARLFLFDEALKAGQFPVRWVDELGFGFGYPLFIFYPPLVYALGDTFHLFGFSFIESIKMVFFLSIFLSGISMYILTKNLFGRLAGLVGVAFYIFVPYRALDVYVRGALAESFAFVWPPLIIWSILSLSKKPKTSSSLTLGLSICALMLTHNLILLPFILIFSGLYLYLIAESKNKKRFITFSLVGFIVAAFLSAFFWLPALLEKKYTIVDELLIVNLADYSKHFVYPTQLWDWTWGFGGSSPGLADGISFKIGKLHILVTAASFIIALATYIKHKASVKIQIKNSKIILIYFGLFIFSTVMTTHYSSTIWKVVEPLAYLQFPWRFLTFTALFSSILAAGFVHQLKLPILKISTATILILAVIVPNFKLFAPQHYRESATDANMTSKESINWEVSQSSFEYSPKGVELVKNKLGANSINIKKSEVPIGKLNVTSGIAQINILEDKPQSVKFSVNVKEDAQITANIFDFPSWELTINGNKSEYTSNNKFKLISFNLEKGSYTGSLQFQNTPLRNIANTISTISFLLFLVYLSKQWLILRHK